MSRSRVTLGAALAGAAGGVAYDLLQRKHAVFRNFPIVADETGPPVDIKSAVGVADYVTTLRRDLTEAAAACGVAHPALITTDDLEVIDGPEVERPLTVAFAYRAEWGLPAPADRAEFIRLMSSQDGTDS